MGMMAPKFIGVNPATGMASYKFAETNPIGFAVEEDPKSSRVVVFEDDQNIVTGTYTVWNWDGVFSDEALTEAEPQETIFDEIGNLEGIL